MVSSIVRKFATSLRNLTGCAALLLLFAMAVFGQKGKDSLTIIEAGRFRVTMTGFTVNRQTNDNILESDGKGDEVYILGELAQYDSYWEFGGRPGLRQDSILINLGGQNGLHGRGNVTLRRSLVSVLMGDVNNQNNPPRIQAGSAGGAGGLRTGDRFPSNEPWNLSGQPRADRLPMLLWEGQLRRGLDLVVIIPTIWEWDGGNPQLRSQFTQDVNYYFTVSTYQDDGFVFRSFIGGDIAGAGDRPIGMLGRDTWVPQGLTLNFDNAQRAVTSSPGRIGTGVVEMRYAADTEDYSLYFKIERIDHN
jgi:hypothetical protein